MTKEILDKEKMEEKNKDKKSRNPKNFNEARGYVIDRTVYIEEQINKILLSKLDYLNKDFLKNLDQEKSQEIKNMRQKHFSEIKKIFLNSAIMGFAGKIKILGNYVDDNHLIEDLKELSGIRNGFAHSRVHQDTTIKMGGDKPEVSINPRLNIMKGHKVKRKEFYKYFEDFLEINGRVREKIHKLTENLH